TWVQSRRRAVAGMQFDLAARRLIVGSLSDREGELSMIRVEIVAIVVAGCSDLASFGELASPITGTCTPGTPGCNANSPVIESYHFHDLHKRGLYANAQGLRIVDFRYGSKSMVLDVRGGRLSGYDGTITRTRA